MASRTFTTLALVSSFFLHPVASAQEGPRDIHVNVQTCGSEEVQPILRAIELEFAVIGLETTSTENAHQLEIQTECFENTARYSKLLFFNKNKDLLLKTNISIPLQKHKTLAIAASEFVRAGLTMERQHAPAVLPAPPPPEPEKTAVLPPTTNAEDDATEWLVSVLQKNHVFGSDYRLGLASDYAQFARKHFVWSLGAEASIASLQATPGLIVSTQLSKVSRLAARFRMAKQEIQVGPRLEIGWSHAFSQPQAGFASTRGNALTASVGLEGLYFFRTEGVWNWHLGSYVSYAFAGLDARFEGESLLLQKGLQVGFKIGFSRRGP